LEKVYLLVHEEKNMKKVIIGTNLIVSAIALSVIWFTDTPRFALYKMGQAIESGDQSKVLSYIKLDDISKQLAYVTINEAQKKSLAVLDNSNPSQMLDTGLGLGMLESMRPSIEANIQQQIIQKISQQVQQKPQGVALKLLLSEIHSEGNRNVVRIVMPDGHVIPMEMRGENGRWQLVACDRPAVEPMIRESLNILTAATQENVQLAVNQQ
jgi:hypothetical protein